MNNKYEIKFDAKLPIDYSVLIKSIVDDIDKIQSLNRMDDEKACSLAYGKTIWQKIMFPLLKDIAYEFDMDSSELAQDLYNWFSHCMIE